jgi:hypothetical protein
MMEKESIFNSMDLLTNNYEWIFSGIGVAVLGFILNFFWKKKDESSLNEVKNSMTNTNTITINNFDSKHKVQVLNGSESEEKKKIQTRILFIDDNYTEYKMVSILKKSGWINTKSVKDVTDLDDPKVIEADIIFVDINGVGTTIFQDQGLGLAAALKRKYIYKKIVLYSAETTGDRFHKALREVDDCLSKNAEPYQFINLIESFTKNN